MHVKYTLLGLLIYLAMLVWTAGLVAYLRKVARTGFILFAGGFVILAVAFVLRWVEVAHPPMQSMFEVFLCLGIVLYPLWLMGRKYLGLTSPAAAMVVGIIVLIPLGFIFEDQPQKLPPPLRSWLFIPHVSAYLLAYVAMILAGMESIIQMAAQAKGDDAAELACERASHNLVRLSFPLLTLGLVLGAVWAKLVWGDYWNWDPKELWSLATFLVYVVYLHFRNLYGTKYLSLNAVWVIIGAACVVITLVVVNLPRIFPGMHSYAS